LLPTQLVVDLVFAEIQRLGNRPLMLDGFPRSMEQAHIVDQRIKFDVVLNIDVPFNTIIERLQVGERENGENGRMGEWGNGGMGE
jgi:nucleoside-triphosphate--adenylate kinase